MSNLRQAIDKLMSSPHYKKLTAYEPPFNPFEIVSATHLELIHSSVLAWLLRDEANKEFRQKFVAEVVEIATAAGKKLKIEFSSPDGSKDCRLEKVCVETEHPFKTEKGEKRRIDVLTEFETLKLVISIEVKIRAGEQFGQIGSHQTFLKEEYSQYEKAVIFLTRWGYSSKTDDKSLDSVPVLEMSWSDIAYIIREMRTAPGNENDFRMQFLQHLERNITMNETEEQRIVYELLSEDDNNLETIGKIINNMSSLQTSLEYKFWTNLRSQLQDQLQLRDEDLEFQLYKSNLEIVYIPPKRLEECIGQREGSLGLTFRIPGSSQGDDHEVACRITYNLRGSSYLYYGFVLCKEDNIRERVKIDNDNTYHKKYLDLGKEILSHGPDKENGWLRWKDHTDKKISFANGPELFNTLVDIKDKERREKIIEDLVMEICKVIKKSLNKQANS